MRSLSCVITRAIDWSTAARQSAPCGPRQKVFAATLTTIAAAMLIVGAGVANIDQASADVICSVPKLPDGSCPQSAIVQPPPAAPQSGPFCPSGLTLLLNECIGLPNACPAGTQSLIPGNFASGCCPAGAVPGQAAYGIWNCYVPPSDSPGAVQTTVPIVAPICPPGTTFPPQAVVEENFVCFGPAQCPEHFFLVAATGQCQRDINLPNHFPFESPSPPPPAPSPGPAPLPAAPPPAAGCFAGYAPDANGNCGRVTTVCPAGTGEVPGPNGTTCECPPGARLGPTGVCQCSGGDLANGQKCPPAQKPCPPGQETSTHLCCPPGSPRRPNGTCTRICPAGQVEELDGSCGPIPTPPPSGGCLPGYVPDPTKGGCMPGLVITPPPPAGTIPGTPAKPAPTPPSGGTTTGTPVGVESCTGGEVVAGKCQCPRTQVPVNGTCGCPPGTQEKDGVCSESKTPPTGPAPGAPLKPTCIGGEELVNGSCQCPSGEVRTDRGCEKEVTTPPKSTVTAPQEPKKNVPPPPPKINVRPPKLKILPPPPKPLTPELKLPSGPEEKQTR